jgi:peptidoglycan hydrolase-like protein with peptidoglycan-binding domain
VQTKYGLPATGVLDAATDERLTSIATSIPESARQLKARNAAELKPLKKAGRLNMKSEHVGDVQGALAFLGFKIDEIEFKTRTFGKSTRDAVVSYQRTRGLAVTGHAAGDTLVSLNRDVERVNPASATDQFPYRVRGSVRNERWQGLAGATVQIWEKRVVGQGAKLAERKTLGNGFFDITYDPPRDAATKKIRQPFHLQVKALSSDNREIGSKLLFNPTRIAWVNFTQGDQPYRGISEFQARMTAVSAAISPGKVGDLVERPGQRQISEAAQAAGLSAEDVMRLVLAVLAAGKLNHPPLGPEACYAYIASACRRSCPEI